MYQAAIYRLALSIALGLCLVETLTAQSHNAMQLQETDPHGFILTLTAVGVVFTVLISLIVFFKSLGKLMQYLYHRHKVQEVQPTECPASSLSPEAVVAIALALRSSKQSASDEEACCIALSLADYINSQHDQESYKLTIRPRPTQWNSRQQGLRKYPH